MSGACNTSNFLVEACDRNRHNKILSPKHIESVNDEVHRYAFMYKKRVKGQVRPQIETLNDQVKQGNNKPGNDSADHSQSVPPSVMSGAGSGMCGSAASSICTAVIGRLLYSMLVRRLCGQSE